jgi:hypothetical protein
MSFSETEIERIVQEVVRRLAAMTAQSLTPAATNGTLSLSTQLVTVSELNGKLQGIRRLEVPLRTVVTPAARDYLRERGVELIRSA